MPYIKKNEREKYDGILDRIKGLYETYGLAIWCRILSGFCSQIEPSYNSYKNLFGEITESAMEIVRRFNLEPDDIRPVDLSGWREFTSDESASFDYVQFRMREKVQVNGDLNYMIFAFAKRHVPRYMLAWYVGVLLETVRMLRSDVLASYEMLKIRENGDVE